jgi:hypothetical protein
MIGNPKFTSVEISKEEGGKELKALEELGREAERTELEKNNKINELKKLFKIREVESEEERKQIEFFKGVKNRIETSLKKNKTELEQLKKKSEESNEEISSPLFPFSPHPGNGDMTISDLKVSDFKVREKRVGQRVSWSDEKLSEETLKQERRNLRDLERIKPSKKNKRID